MKKTISLLLACLMLLPLLAACGESEVNADPGTDSAAATESSPEAVEVVEEEDPLSDGLPETDLNGYDFRLFSMIWTDGIEAGARIMAEETTGEAINDALRESTLDVEERFNCTISMLEAGDVYHLDETVSNIIQAGDDAFEIVAGHDGTMNGLMNKGLFYNLKNVDQFDFDKPWWEPSKVLELEGKLYLASSYLSYTGLHWTRALMVNKRITEDMGLEIPYNSVREGTWTFDEMIALTADTFLDLNGNGRKDPKDQIGLCTGTETLYCFQESLGLAAYAREADGSVVLAYDTDRMDTAMAKLRSLKASDDFTYKTDSSFSSETFKSDTAMMVLGQIADAYSIYRECDFSYGFLPCPKYDENQKDYISGCTDLPWAIPKTIPDGRSDIIGTVVEALSACNYKRVLPVYFDTVMKNRIADCPDDAEMLQIIADTRTICFSMQYGLEFFDVMRQLILSQDEVASFYQKNAKVAQKKLELLISSFREWE